MVYNRTDSRKCPAIKEIAKKKLAKIQALIRYWNLCLPDNS